MENTFSELIKKMTDKGVNIPDFLDWVGEATDFGQNGGEDFTYTLAFLEQEVGMTRNDALALVDTIHEVTGYVSDFELCINLDNYIYGDEEDDED